MSYTQVPVLAEETDLEHGYPTLTREDYTVDVSKQRFPFAIVWGPLPVLSWICPLIGHVGICDSQGNIHDFHGPFTVITGRFMTGSVYKYFQFGPYELRERLGPDYIRKWDQAIKDADETYSHRMHNLITNNCHHHAADACKNANIPMTFTSVFGVLTADADYMDNIVSIFLPSLIFYLVVALLSYFYFFK